MLRRRTSGPLPRRDASGRYLPWVIAVMVYIAALALAGALVLDAAVRDWVANLSGRVTVEIPPPTGGGDAREMDKRIAAVLAVLRDAPEVAEARPLSRDEMAALIEPWLGAAAAQLPLPRLVDVRLAPGADADLARLDRRLAEAVPGARVEDHKPWLERLTALGRSLQWLAGAVVVLIGLATIAIVGFATRAGLVMHGNVIEVLHLIGARDSYIARQFQDETLRISVGGAAVGLTAALATVFGLAKLAAGLEVPLLPPPDFGLAEWTGLVATSVVAVAMATLTARITVLRALKKMV